MAGTLEELRAEQVARAAEQVARATAERERDELRVRLAQRNARLGVSWSPIVGRSLDLVRQTVPLREVTEDPRRQDYLLVVANMGEFPLLDVNLRFEFPYPVDAREINPSSGALNPTFEPAASRVSVVPIGGGSASVRPACTPAYNLGIAELRPFARTEVFVRLFSGRDPRGRKKPIPPQEAARYFVPEWGPTQTYASGRYRYSVGGALNTRDFYAPFELREDKTVVLGPSSSPPAKLAQSMVALDNCNLP
jgi:hypothetical protein